MLKLVKFPDPILRERMPEFDFDNPVENPKQLEKEMIAIMQSNGGIGLAANQVGVRTRLFVMGQGEHAVGIFNPIVDSADDLKEDEEGCLSFPGIFAKIKRPNKINARWQNSDGEWQESEIEGFTARCFLHELDHLEGIVYQDRTSQLKWALAVKKSQKRQRKF
jgi:peptide deformylase